MQELPGAWSVIIDQWVDWLRMRGLSANTIRLRRQHLRGVARRCGASTPEALTREALRTFIAGHESWAAEYRKSVRASICSFYAYARAEGVVDDDISDCLPAVKTPLPRARPATDQIWLDLLRVADPRTLLMCRLAGEAGMRRAEVARVHSDDLIDDVEGPALIVHGKGGRQRVVPITDSLADALHRLPRGFVFPGRTDGHVSANYVGTLVSDQMPPGWSMHKLRHRYATRGYAATGNLRAVQEALGHASVATTQRYTAVSSRDVRAVSEAASRPIGRQWS